MKVDPQKMLDKLCRNASARKAESLKLIFKICEEQKMRGSSDYSIVTIGHLSSERGGPSAAAIRNKPGEDYRALIKVYADSADGYSRKRSKSDGDPVDEILEGISDPVLRARLNLLLAEMRALRAQLLGTRHLANQNAVLELDRSPHAEAKTWTGAPDVTLSPVEIDAIENALSAATLEHWGWSIDKSGRVLTDTGQVVFRAGFATAIKKTIQAAKDVI